MHRSPVVPVLNSGLAEGYLRARWGGSKDGKLKAGGGKIRKQKESKEWGEEEKENEAL